MVHPDSLTVVHFFYILKISAALQMCLNKNYTNGKSRSVYRDSVRRDFRVCFIKTLFGNKCIRTIDVLA